MTILMTSASELFHNRRSSRVGRGSPDLYSDRTSHRRHHCNYHVYHLHHHHQDSQASDPLRRSLYVRPHLERAAVRPEQSTSQFVSSNSANTENLSSTSRPRLIENEDRLPGDVLLARARLLERLRGLPISANRGRGRPLSDRAELMLEDDPRELVDDQDVGTQASAGQSAGSSTITSLTSQIERLQLFLKPKKKPPGLSQEALDCLHLEVFSSKVEGAVSRASQDCSICLDTFVEGDALIHLPCSHRFHSACLDPWVRTCGDCPYCRRSIVTSHKASKS
ncbi:probable E3 ubiquitin-protein ligase RHY1A isoform X1 [Quercus suber]|uniref:E3 ubiquitin-protein ligase rhy1a n=1 Tax=Quercus suber TaxID=58331 RepID=A0AAW0K4B5_QUESU|nr:probable E3 ubiquitin-protein ligase RHY1A isoform X1 [Quercus suber]